MSLIVRMGEQTFSTAEVMKAFDLGRNTLRLYEEIGLLSAMPRSDSGYRKFNTQNLEEIRFILNAKKAGFTLGEIKELLNIARFQKKMTCGIVSSRVSKKIDQVKTQIEQLTTKQNFLSDFLRICQTNKSESKCDVVSVGFSRAACCEPVSN